MEYCKSHLRNIAKWSRIYPKLRVLAKTILGIIMYIIYGISYRLFIEYRKKNTEASVVASKETGLEVNADETEYMVMSQDRNAEWSHNIRIDNSSFERIEEFEYLGTVLTN